MGLSAAQQLAPQHLCDQRRHTIDFSAWKSAVSHDLQTRSAVNNPAELTSFTIATTTAAAVSAVSQSRSLVSLPPFNTTTKSDMASSHNPSVSKAGKSCQPFTQQMHTYLAAEPRYDSGRMLPGVPPSQISTLSNNENHGEATVQMHPWPKMQGLEAYSGRRASTQVSIYGSIWEQPDSTPFHRHSQSFQMNYPCDNTLPAGASQRSHSGSERGHGMSLSNLNSDNSASQLQLITHQQQPLPGSDRRKSRVLPNPIQPPAAFHARKLSIDRQGLRDQDPSQEVIQQHRGFTPGYNIWASRNDQAPEITSKVVRGYLAGIRPDIQSERRKSESILDEMEATDSIHTNHDSNYQQSVNLSTVPSFRAFMGTSARSVSPLDGQGSVQQSAFGIFKGDHGLSLQSGSECYPLSPLDQGFAFAGSAPQLSGSKPSRPQIGAQAQATILQSMDPFPARHGGNTHQYNNGLCELCNVQRGVISMGGCGHRVCNVCHQHERHRAMRLFQNPTPPCPFCTRGVVPTSGQVNTSLTVQTSGAGSFKQRALPLPQLHLPPFTNQQSQQLQQQQRHSKQTQGSPSQRSYNGGVSEEPAHGYSYNQYHCNTLPNLVTSQTVAWQCMSSEKSDGAHGSNNSVAERGTVDYPGYLFQPQHQGSTSRPPAGIYPSQVTAAGSNVQEQVIHPSDSNQNLAPGGAVEVHHDSNDFAVSRAGMTDPSAGAWRENLLNSDHDLQIFPFAQPKVTPSRLYQHQKRRSSLQHINRASNVSAGHQSHGSGHGMHTKLSVTLSLSMLSNLPPAVPPTVPRTEAIQWAVIRVTNIPWDISLHDMLSFVSDVPHPPEHLLSQNVHILMDRTTGKTFNSAFIELAVTLQQAEIVVQVRNQKVLKGRLVTVELSSQDELMRSVFPKWPGEFANGEPVVPREQPVDPRSGLDAGDPLEVDDDKEASGGTWTYQAVARTSDLSLCLKPSTRPTPFIRAMNGTLSGSSSTGSISAGLRNVGRTPSIPEFVTRDEINALLVVCRNYRLHFSRKCAERPFENIISILVKYPWHQPHLPLHRDHIFELLKLSIESLRMHLSREYNIDPTLLSRIVRSAILSPAFTERQKAMVLCVANCPCPEDIVGWMTPPCRAESERAKDTMGSGSQVDDESTTSIQDDTGVDSQEMSRQSPDLEEVDTQIEGLTILGEMDTNPPVMMLPKSQQSVKGGVGGLVVDDQSMFPDGTTAPGIDSPLSGDTLLSAEAGHRTDIEELWTTNTFTGHGR